MGLKIQITFCDNTTLVKKYTFVLIMEILSLNII